MSDGTVESRFYKRQLRDCKPAWRQMPSLRIDALTCQQADLLQVQSLWRWPQAWFRCICRFFGGGFGFGGQEEEEEQTPKGNDVHVELEVTLRDLYLGAAFTVSICRLVARHSGAALQNRDQST